MYILQYQKSEKQKSVSVYRQLETYQLAYQAMQNAYKSVRDPVCQILTAYSAVVTKTDLTHRWWIYQSDEEDERAQLEKRKRQILCVNTRPATVLCAS